MVKGDDIRIAGVKVGSVKDVEIHDRTKAIKTLQTANLDENHPTDLMDEAVYMRDTVMTAMSEVREIADQLERTVADDLWPLPRYSEMLFIK